MARFNAGDAEKYGGQGGSGFFSIAKNHESKRVRFLYNTIDDVEGLSVHKIKVDGKDKYVNCLRSYSDPLDMCPFCREKMQPQARVFVPMYNVDEKQVQIWDRGKTFFQKLTSLCSRYASNGASLVAQQFDVERNGEPKDQKTTYEIYPLNVPADNTKLEDFELPDVFSGLVLNKTAEDMEYWLETGNFPPAEDAEDEPPFRRRNAEVEHEDRSAVGRRTPAGRQGREAF